MYYLSVKLILVCFLINFDILSIIDETQIKEK